jgi:ribosomal protein S27AE
VSHDAPRGHDELVQMAADLGVPAERLRVLAKDNDPFACGTDMHVREATWFGKVWQKFGCGVGYHVRRVHYKVISQKTPLLMTDRSPYENTDECWKGLTEASKYARHLGVVDAAHFVDHRNPEPVIHANYETPPDYSDEPSWEADDLPEWSLPKIPTTFEPASFDLPDVTVKGYDYYQGDQRYHLELWVEKSTMDDVLLPVCERWHVNYVTGVGFQSISSVIRLLERIQRLPRDQPVRVWYGSDWDPGGLGMPVGVARQIEFYLERYAPGADIKLTPLFLTQEQVLHYRLPRTPIKKSDRRRRKFERQYGKGATELDALEAIYPGRLARIVEDAFRPYRDESLEGRLEEAQADAEDAARRALEDATEEQREELDELGGQVDEITQRYEARLAELDEELQAELQPLRERLDSVRHDVLEAVRDLDVDLPPRPEAEEDTPDEDDWLFDSSRDYVEQLGYYQTYQGGQSLKDCERTCPRCGKTFMASRASQRFCSKVCSRPTPPGRPKDRPPPKG